MTPTLIRPTEETPFALLFGVPGDDYVAPPVGIVYDPERQYQVISGTNEPVYQLKPGIRTITTIEMVTRTGWWTQGGNDGGPPRFDSRED